MTESLKSTAEGPTNRNYNIIVAITGASGAALGVKIAQLLANHNRVNLHLILSQSAYRTINQELGAEALSELEQLSATEYDVSDIGAAIASGSFPTAGMIIAPCSMRSLAALANGFTDNLIIRAADVQLKERRRLILLPRETPLHLGHIKNMQSATESGAIIMPPVPAFYQNPLTIADIVTNLALHAIHLLDLPLRLKPQAWIGRA